MDEQISRGRCFANHTSRNNVLFQNFTLTFYDATLTNSVEKLLYNADKDFLGSFMQNIQQTCIM